MPSATGRLCEWKEDEKQPANFFTSFGAYQRSLSLFCQEGEWTWECRGWRSDGVLQDNLASSSGPRTGTRRTQCTTSASLTGFSAGRLMLWTDVISNESVVCGLTYLFYLFMILKYNINLISSLPLTQSKRYVKFCGPSARLWNSLLTLFHFITLGRIY